MIDDETLKPLSVYFRTDWQKHIADEAKSKLNDDAPWRIKYCSTWDELGDVLREKPANITVHIDMVTHVGVTIVEFVNMIETLLKVSMGKVIPIGVAITQTTTTDIIKTLQKTTVNGIIPCIEFGVDETYRGVEALYNRIPYWPKHILQQLPGASKSVTKNTITLTQRQSEIAELISSRGLSNKRIALALNIAESTVKIHVSAILKAYGVRTRTQLAVLANQ
jgi:DNA-binding NarL/FixJ family response regulator